MFVTPFYAALLAFMYFLLSIRTLRLRRELGIAIGDQGNERMLRSMRVHSNFSEYAPLTLLLSIMLELQGALPIAVHLICVFLLAGRISHAFGVAEAVENFRYRVFGMAMTFTALIGSASYLLLGYVWPRLFS